MPAAVGGWRTDLLRLVLLLQVGNAVNFFGYGLILQFEIIYLHQIRGFPTATAGWPRPPQTRPANPTPDTA
jgi:hypothetical protein